MVLAWILVIICIVITISSFIVVIPLVIPVEAIPHVKASISILSR